MKRTLFLALIVTLTGALTGCVSGFGERAQYGITFYCPGAGNVDMGDAGIRKGLERAGYQGQVARVTWTLSFNPAIDQAVRVNARLGASRLAGAIEEYFERYPEGEVNVIGLSAGTGVALWALEDLDPQYQVNNVILLASSLSNDYDVSKAAARVKGRIYNYYSPNDFVLAGPMKVFGTIDGRFGVDGAGAVGLHSPGATGRVVNVRWRPDFERLGYAGGHMDSTSPAFVREHIAQHIVTPLSAGLLATPESRRMLYVLRGEEPRKGLKRSAPTRVLTREALTQRIRRENSRYLVGNDSAADPEAVDRMLLVLRGYHPTPPVTEAGRPVPPVTTSGRALRVLETEQRLATRD